MAAEQKAPVKFHAYLEFDPAAGILRIRQDENGEPLKPFMDAFGDYADNHGLSLNIADQNNRSMGVPYANLQSLREYRDFLISQLEGSKKAVKDITDHTLRSVTLNEIGIYDRSLTALYKLVPQLEPDEPGTTTDMGRWLRQLIE